MPSDPRDSLLRPAEQPNSNSTARPYQRPRLVCRGSLAEQTRGPREGSVDGDLTGTGE